jgi:ribonuclease BN (tRNA processing enzyme)
LRVVLLGTGTLIPEADRVATGLLIEGRGAIIPVDLGRGVLNRMVEAGVDPLRLGRFFLTHLHPDHSAELVSLLFALRHGRESPDAVELCGPDGLGDLVRRICEAWPSVVPDYPLEIRETAGGVLVDEPLRVIAGPVHHGEHPALGYRIEDRARGSSVAFTGDSGPGGDLLRLVAGVDLLIAECGDGLRPRRGRHLDVDSLISLVEDAGVGRVVVTHLDPRLDPGRVITALADALGDRLIEARDGLEFRV